MNSRRDGLPGHSKFPRFRLSKRADFFPLVFELVLSNFPPFTWELFRPFGKTQHFFSHLIVLPTKRKFNRLTQPEWLRRP